VSSLRRSRFTANMGGVVPELASREHLRQIVPVVREAIARAGNGAFECGRDWGDARAGAGGGRCWSEITYGKTLAQALGKPLVPVNHLEGHVHAVFLEAHKAGRATKLPAVCLIVSGGHTVLYEVKTEGSNGQDSNALLRYRKMGQTRDDAAGEAYDKVAKRWGLGYPGGPILDRLAAVSNHAPAPVKFGPTKMKGTRWTSASAD